MIIVDLNQVMISNLMVHVGPNMKIEIDLVRHMVINSLRANNMKFKSEYGELIIATDDTNFWRKDIYPYYKVNRKKERDASEIDWTSLFKALNTIREEIKAFFPYRVIQVERAEADDIIAALVMRWKRSEPVLILSGDKDFSQLQYLPFVKQYDPVRKTWIKTKDAEKFLWEHIIRGDRSDGVPNIRSSDSCLVEGIRQKPITQKLLKEWMDGLTLSNSPETVFEPELLKNWKRNENLIDLRNIPDEIFEETYKQFDEQAGKNRTKLYNYFIKYRLKQLMAHISEF